MPNISQVSSTVVTQPMLTLVEADGLAARPSRRAARPTSEEEG